MATFCLIHGNWHDGSCWDRLVPELEARGHRAVAPDLPVDDPETTWDDRVSLPLGLLSHADGPVVVIGHSAASGYAAIVAERAPAQLLITFAPGWRSSTIRRGSRGSSARRSHFRRGATTARSSGSRRTR